MPNSLRLLLLSQFSLSRTTKVLNDILTYLSKSCDPSVRTHPQFQSSRGQRTKEETLVHYINLQIWLRLPLDIISS